MTFPQVIFTCGLIPVTLVSPWLYILREKYARDEFKRFDESKLNLALNKFESDSIDQQMNLSLPEDRLLSKLYAKYEGGNASLMIWPRLHVFFS